MMFKQRFKLPCLFFIILGFCNPVRSEDFEIINTGINTVDRSISLTLDSSGKVVVLGEVAVSSGSDICLQRYTSDDELDTTFGDEGVVLTNVGTNDLSEALTIDSSGRILVAGYNSEGGFLLRYKSNGTLDSTFSTDGIVTTDIGTSDKIRAVALDSSGRILVAGYNSEGGFLLRYKSNGTLDSTFNGDGIVTTDVGGSDTISAVALDSSGRILIAGYFGKYVTHGSSTALEHDSFVARYKSDGTLDTTFEDDGIIIIDNGYMDFSYALTVDSSGRILIANGLNEGYGVKINLLRYTSEGDLDTSFGDGGMTTTSISGKHSYPKSLIVDSSGKILIGANTLDYSQSDSNILLLRYNSDGSPDTTFGDNGIITTDDGTYDYIGSIVLDSSGKIILGKYTDNEIVIAKYTPVSGETTGSGGDSGSETPNLTEGGGGGCQLTTISGSVFHLSSFIFLLPLLAIMAMRMKKNNAF